jgi:hypothetical protein
MAVVSPQAHWVFVTSVREFKNSVAMEMDFYVRKHLRTFISTSSINVVDKSRISAANFPKLRSSTRAAFTSVINFLGWWDNHERIFNVFGNLSTTYWHDSLSLHQSQKRLSVGCLLFWNKHASPIRPNHTMKFARPSYECRHCTSTFPLHNTWPTHTPSVALYRNCKCRGVKCFEYHRSYNLRIFVSRKCLAKFFTHFHHHHHPLLPV